MKNYLALFLAVLVAYAPTICYSIPQHFLFRRTASVPDYTVNTAVFDGTDYIRSENAGGAGFTDGTAVTVSVWIKPTNFSTQRNIVSTATGSAAYRLALYTDTSGLITFKGYDSSSTLVFHVVASSSLTTGVWNHVHYAIDTTSSANTKLWVNGTEDSSLTEVVLGVANGASTNTIDMEHTGDRFTISGSSSVPPNTFLFDGSLAELWLNDSYVGNNSLFYSDGNPVSLGVNGVTPTGAQPCFYFSGNGSGNSWTNQGTAGTNFVVGGSLGTDTSP